MKIGIITFLALAYMTNVYSQDFINQAYGDNLNYSTRIKTKYFDNIPKQGIFNYVGYANEGDRTIYFFKSPNGKKIGITDWAKGVGKEYKWDENSLENKSFTITWIIKNEEIKLLSAKKINDLSSQRYCLHKNLSKNYDYKVQAIETKDSSGISHFTKVKVDVIKKSTQQIIQTIFSDISEDGYDYYDDCGEVFSYITGYKKKEYSNNNGMGDFMVADFNFDGREDFAFKTNNYFYTPQYKYYTFQSDSTFKEDTFIVGGAFTITQLKLKQYSRYLGDNETIYNYMPMTQKWIKIKSIRHKN